MPNMHLSTLVEWIVQGHSPEVLLCQPETGAWYELMYRHPELFNRIAATHSRSLSARLTTTDRYQKEPFHSRLDRSHGDAKKHLDKALSELDAHGYLAARAEIARELVIVRGRVADPSSPDLLARLWSDDTPPIHRAVLEEPARLWMALYCLHKTDGYDNATKIARLSLEDTVIRMAEQWPATWAESLPLLLRDASGLGDIVEAVTIPLVEASRDVHNALAYVAEHAPQDRTRDLARGLLILAEAAEQPVSETVGRLGSV
jgi:hypothetical protein